MVKLEIIEALTSKKKNSSAPHRSGQSSANRSWTQGSRSSSWTASSRSSQSSGSPSPKTDPKKSSILQARRNNHPAKNSPSLGPSKKHGSPVMGPKRNPTSLGQKGNSASLGNHKKASSTTGRHKTKTCIHVSIEHEGNRKGRMGPVRNVWPACKSYCAKDTGHLWQVRIR